MNVLLWAILFYFCLFASNRDMLPYLTTCCRITRSVTAFLSSSKCNNSVVVWLKWLLAQIQTTKETHFQIQSHLCGCERHTERRGARAVRQASTGSASLLQPRSSHHHYYHHPPSGSLAHQHPLFHPTPPPHPGGCLLFPHLLNKACTLTTSPPKPPSLSPSNPFALPQHTHSHTHTALLL